MGLGMCLGMGLILITIGFFTTMLPKVGGRDMTTELPLLLLSGTWHDVIMLIHELLFIKGLWLGRLECEIVATITCL